MSEQRWGFHFFPKTSGFSLSFLWGGSKWGLGREAHSKMNVSIFQNDIVFSLPYTGLRGMLIQWSQIPFFFPPMHVWGIAEDCCIFQIAIRNDRSLTWMGEQCSSAYLTPAVIQLTPNNKFVVDFREITKCLMRTGTFIDKHFLQAQMPAVITAVVRGGPGQ